MARRLIGLTNLPVAAAIVATAGLGAAALTLASGDAVVKRGFERALAAMPDRARADRARFAAGTERLLLTHVVHDPDAAFARPVAVGDRITIASGGRERTLNVVDVTPIDNAIVPVSSERPAPLLLVTCRDEANPEGRPVRFLIEAGDDLPALSAKKTARAL